MRQGIPYDSPKALAICGAITAIMTGEAYGTSAEMAAELSPFPGYANNREHMLRVIRNDGTKIGYPLGLSTFAEMDENKVIGIVRGNAAYSSYLRTVREWAAIHLGDTTIQKQQALILLADIDKYLGKNRSESQ